MPSQQLHGSRAGAAEKRQGRITETPKVRLPSGAGSELATWAADLAAEGGAAAPAIDECGARWAPPSRKTS